MLNLILILSYYHSHISLVTFSLTLSLPPTFSLLRLELCMPVALHEDSTSSSGGTRKQQVAPWSSSMPHSTRSQGAIAALACGRRPQAQEAVTSRDQQSSMSYPLSLISFLSYQLDSDSNDDRRAVATADKVAVAQSGVVTGRRKAMMYIKLFFKINQISD